eukprot:11384252-Alexandrium_andersonii.AAC.1
MQSRFMRSNLELRRPRSGLEIGTQSSRGARSVPFFAQNPNPPTKAGLEGVGGREIGNSQAPIRNPLIRNPRKTLLSKRGGQTNIPRGPPPPDPREKHLRHARPEKAGVFADAVVQRLLPCAVRTSNFIPPTRFLSQLHFSQFLSLLLRDAHAPRQAPPARPPALFVGGPGVCAESGADRTPPELWRSILKQFLGRAIQASNASSNFACSRIELLGSQRNTLHKKHVSIIYDPSRLACPSPCCYITAHQHEQSNRVNITSLGGRDVGSTSFQALDGRAIAIAIARIERAHA